jgi:hypothetical protein
VIFSTNETNGAKKWLEKPKFPMKNFWLRGKNLKAPQKLQNFLDLLSDGRTTIAGA